jgi:hypothetical protein
MSARWRWDWGSNSLESESLFRKREIKPNNSTSTSTVRPENPWNRSDFCSRHATNFYETSIRRRHTASPSALSLRSCIVAIRLLTGQTFQTFNRILYLISLTFYTCCILLYQNGRRQQRDCESCKYIRCKRVGLVTLKIRLSGCK